MKILRVFPRRTNATPDDDLTWIGEPGLFRDDVDEVHISVTFSYDREDGERLRKSWSKFHPVTKIGGPGMGDSGGDFTPGMYLKDGYVITSRGCPNKCWFCDVWRREGPVRELPITEGWNVLDDNLLACSEKHIEKVFDMLRKQKTKAQFTGGFDPKLITKDIAKKLSDLKPTQMFTAYDTPDDYEPLLEAGKVLHAEGLNHNTLRCYVLIGYPKDTMDAAEARLRDSWYAGFMPMAMLYRDKDGEVDQEWKRFQRSWARPPAIKAQMRDDKRQRNIDKKAFCP